MSLCVQPGVIYVKVNTVQILSNGPLDSNQRLHIYQSEGHGL